MIKVRKGLEHMELEADAREMVDGLPTTDGWSPEVAAAIVGAHDALLRLARVSRAAYTPAMTDGHPSE